MASTDLDALTAAHAAALDRVAELRGDLADVIDSASSTTGDDEHDPEGATIGYERARTQALLDGALARLAELDAAVARVGQGGYGRCVSCRRPIRAERLAARPGTDRCVECASGAPRRGR